MVIYSAKSSEHLSFADRDMPVIGAFLRDQKKPQTNADRIRSMTDEELAVNMMCPNENGLAEIDCEKNDNCNCYECLLKWLKAESEE